MLAGITKIKPIFSSEKKTASVIIIAGILVAVVFSLFWVSQNALALTACYTQDVSGTTNRFCRVGPGSWAQIDYWGQGCKRIENNASSDVYVPYTTSGEWTSFLNNHPANVTVTTCGGGSGCSPGFSCSYYETHVLNACGGGLTPPLFNTSCIWIAGTSTNTPGYDCRHLHNATCNSSSICVTSSYSSKTEPVNQNPGCIPE